MASVCLHNKFGYCKHGEKCREIHVKETCHKDDCDVTKCRRRHPKDCRYFQLYKRCKFGDFCAFSHTIRTDPVLEEIKFVRKKVEDLEKEIKEKNDEIKTVLRNIDKTLKTLNLPNIVPNTPYSTVSLPNVVSATQSTLAIVTSNPSNTTTSDLSSENYIPQLDGHVEDHSSSSQYSENTCENCNKNFESKAVLKKHTDEHEWGCEDCFLCFTSKCDVDLHEMEVHGDTPDSIGYIRDHIPESTKRLFAAGHRGK